MNRVLREQLCLICFGRGVGPPRTQSTHLFLYERVGEVVHVSHEVIDTAPQVESIAGSVEDGGVGKAQLFTRLDQSRTLPAQLGEQTPNVNGAHTSRTFNPGECDVAQSKHTRATGTSGAVNNGWPNTRLHDARLSNDHQELAKGVWVLRHTTKLGPGKVVEVEQFKRLPSLQVVQPEPGDAEALAPVAVDAFDH